MSKNVLDQDSTMMDFERAYKKQKVDNAQPKQALDMQLDREREKTAELKIVEDISQLLVTGKWSDVTISVGGKDFAVHRNILSARSSIFADLFEKNCKENCLVISDIDVDVFEMLLGFIYTGKVPALEATMAQDLLAAAEKYKLEQLKTIAEDYLNRTASPSTNPRSLPPIARLHDPCLVALFRQLPPADQITAHTVCRRWADLVSYAARSTRSLAILVNRSRYFAEDRLNRLSHGPDWKLLKLLRKEDGTPLLPMHSLTKWNSLVFSTLNEETVTQIMATFPVLKDLQLSAQCEDKGCTATTPSPPSILDHLAGLLDHWRPQLTTLKLDVEISSILTDVKLSIDRLGAAISSLSALKYLYFNLNWNKQSSCLHLSNLSQLTHLTTNSLYFVYKLSQYDPLNSAPAQISYDGREWDDAIHSSACLNENLRHRFLRIDDGRSAYYDTVCTNFPSLTSAYLFLANITFRDLLTHASQLTQLVHLKLDIHFSAIRPDDQPHHLLPQLKSVKLLQLEITKQQSHSDLAQLNLGWTMPNVQVIYFDFWIPFRCTPCGILNGPTPNEKTKQCLRQMFAPLKRHCVQLRTITHNLQYSLGTAEEILAEPINEAASPPVDTESIDVVSAD